MVMIYYILYIYCTYIIQIAYISQKIISPLAPYSNFPIAPPNQSHKTLPSQYSPKK